MAKVKVKILNSIVGANFSYSAGQEVEMDEAQYNAIKAHCELLNKPKATAKKKATKNVREL